jgi:CBS domain-containing protein
VRAAQIMTENPRAVTGDASISEVAGMMRDLDVGIVPVVDNDQNRRLRGVITDRDIAIRAVAEGRDGSSTVSECMTERVRAVNKNDSVQDVMRVMRQEQVRRVPVTDREGRLVGIIAQADLAVDYGSADPERESEVSEVLERVSEPARPTADRFVATGRSAKQQSGDSEERGARS